jgi:hypothetical protein
MTARFRNMISRFPKFEVFPHLWLILDGVFQDLIRFLWVFWGSLEFLKSVMWWCHLAETGSTFLEFSSHKAESSSHISGFQLVSCSFCRFFIVFWVLKWFLRVFGGFFLVRILEGFLRFRNGFLWWCLLAETSSNLLEPCRHPPKSSSLVAESSSHLVVSSSHVAKSSSHLVECSGI